ncbi:40S ribosomal protein S12 isoform X5 [Heterocephalus glaber]|nr:40S ribosomal protein S12 isoform X5 [Heterocephalus glaber]
MYVKLVEALCAEHQINLIKVDDNKKLGEWVGLCKIDREGKPRKVVGCSCVVVKANNSGSKGPCLQKQGAAAESPVHLPEGSDAGEPRCSTKELALKNGIQLGTLHLQGRHRNFTENSIRLNTENFPSVTEFKGAPTDGWKWTEEILSSLAFQKTTKQNKTKQNNS